MTDSIETTSTETIETTSTETEPKVEKDPRQKFGLIVVVGTNEFILDASRNLVEGGEITDELFRAPLAERPLWWHSAKGAEKAGEKLMADLGWDAVRAAEVQLPEFIGERTRFPSRNATAPEAPAPEPAPEAPAAPAKGKGKGKKGPAKSKK